MLLNLHAHSTFSDGADTIMDMAIEAKRLNHAALVITDHGTCNGKAYWEGRAYVDALKDELPLPVIVGTEFNSPIGHHLLFGRRAVSNYYEYERHLNYVCEAFDMGTYCDLFESYVLHRATYNMYGTKVVTRNKLKPVEYAMILNHPRNSTSIYNNMPQKWFDMCDGFEIQNHCDVFEGEHIETLRRRIKGVELRNSDAHCKDSLSLCANEIGERKLECENHLICWIKSNKSL